MFRRPIKEINAEFSAEEKYLDSIMRTARESCSSAGLDRKQTQAVLLAIEEAATNVIRHAYLYEKGILRLRIVIYQNQIVFSVIDFGRSFQPEGSGQVDLKKLVDSGRKGGLGFYMINKIMDSVEYISGAGFNEMRMIKRISGSGSGSRPLLRRMFGLRVRFSVWTFLIVSVIIFGSYYYIDHQTTQQIYAHLDQRVQALGKTITAQAGGYVINSRSDVEFDQLIVSYMRANPVLKLIVLVDERGLVMAHSEDIRRIRQPLDLPYDLPDEESSVVNHFELPDKLLSYLGMPLIVGDRVLGKIHIVYSSEEIQGQLTEARTKTLSLTVVLLLFGVIGIYLLSNYFVRPIVRITDRIRRFTSGDLDSELPLSGAEEFFEISRAFNQMMTRLSRDRDNSIAREKLAKEMEVASEIQKTLLPTDLPELPGLELDSFYRAASMVGGDLYDVFEIAPGRFCLTVADVSGKGVPASLVMSMLRTVIQIQAQGAKSARQVMLRVNDYLKDNIPSGMFVTVQLLIYDASKRKISMVSAGHNPLILYKAATKKILSINPSGMPLGLPVKDDSEFKDQLKEVWLELDHGDLILAYTDGVTEASNRDGEQFGVKRLNDYLKKVLSNGQNLSVTSLKNNIVLQLDDFSGFAPATDDITFFAARYTGDSTTVPDDPEHPEREVIQTTSIADNSSEVQDG